MDFKPLVSLLLLAMALATVAEASKMHHEYGFHHNSVGDLVGEENEMLLDSETGRRTLEEGQRYISYGALRSNQAPCGNRGNSYYNCQQRGRANPYNRGCSRITHCARDTS
ncbi:hypothetical protein VNO78_11802 [Psophocarpus tetragonolobus]|uniref:Rapid ALkalinization Factor n=1 Tax=Psophocarpus tetragonolobus TaxID=3891 RepID=A0AAN9SNW8_PSOTE